MNNAQLRGLEEETMIRNLVDFALNNRYVVLAIGLLLLGWGAVSFHNMPVEVYPDIADNYVNIISQWSGRSAEEMEQQVSVPVEIQMFGIPHLTTVRSESIFGLSLITLIFDDQSVNEWNRQKVLERLTQVNMPAGVLPQIGTDWSLTGQIYWYTIRSTNPAYDLMNLRSIEDWTLYKEFRKVPNVVDVSDFGGTAREYQVRVDPNKLISYGLSISQVENQLAINNVNAGGSFVEEGLQQLNVRALGLYRSVQDIENTVLTTSNGAPVRVKDIAVVEWGPRIRLGHMARADHRPDGVIVDEPDVIQGGVLMRKGAEEGPTLEGIHKKVDELNNHILPEGVKVIPMLDRSDLLHYTLAHGAAQPRRGNDPGNDHPLSLSRQCSRSLHRCAHHSVFPAFRVHISQPEPYPRKPDFTWRARLRNGRRRRGRHDGKHHAAFEPRNKPNGPHAGSGPHYDEHEDAGRDDP
jgi:cobalt-zinc-cadmium resistance protein CzcA